MYKDWDMKVKNCGYKQCTKNMPVSNLTAANVMAAANAYWTVASDGCVQASNYTVSLGDLQCKPAYPQESPKKENNMNAIYIDQSTTNLEAAQKSYLGDRAYTVYREKLTEMKKPFGLVNDEQPRTLKEFLARITEGKFAYDKDDFEKRQYGPEALLYLIEWRDPAVKKDKEGYDAAVAKMLKELTKVRDVIVVKNAVDGLAAVEAFESATFH